MYQRTLAIQTSGRGLHDITGEVTGAFDASGLQTGLCHLFIQHTSASLVIQENADPDVLRDLEDWFARSVRDGDPRYRHHAEGPDDMPAHIRSALTPTSLVIPVVDGALGLGTWQGVFVYEHRRGPKLRSVVVTVQGE